MKFQLLVALLAVVLATAVTASKASRAELVAKFEAFKVQHKRVYKDAAEEAHRFRVFVENMRKAASLQATNPLATFGANEFADVSAAEFKNHHNAEKFLAARIAKAGKVPNMFTEAQVKASVQKIDWRTKGAVTAVKNQLNCGGCWSFSTTGNIEGQWFLAGNTLTSASEQNLLSCDNVDDGCHGGDMDNAWQWLINNQNGSIVTEASYPFVSGNGVVPACSESSSMPIAGTISGFNNLPQNEDQMATWLSTGGPISIGVDGTSFQTYNGGIVTNCISVQPDHAVLIVGYDNTYSTPYWIIKNSWGTIWGESGYIRVAKGSDQCLITCAPGSASVSGGPSPVTQPPSPTSPPGPSNPTSAPANPPSGSDFTQYTCADFLCIENCTSVSFPQNTCLQAQGGSSAVAQCTSQGLLITAYNTTDCQGPSQQGLEPVDQCTNDGSNYIYNYCPSTSQKLAKPAKRAGKNAKVELPKALAAKLRKA